MRRKLSGIVGLAVVGPDAEIVVATEIDIVIGRDIVIVDVEILELGLFLFLLFLLDFLEWNRLLGLQDRFGIPLIATIDAGDRIVLAQIIEASAAFRAAMLGAPFRLDHEKPFDWTALARSASVR